MISERVRPGNTTLAATVTAASRAADLWAQPPSELGRPGSGAELLSITDPRFPRMLRLIEDPPQHLDVRGSLGHARRAAEEVNVYRGSSAVAQRLENIGPCYTLWYGNAQ